MYEELNIIDMIKKIVLLIVLVSSLAVNPLKAQNGYYESQKRPKLVVNIVMSHFRYDYIKKYHDGFSEFGFKRLLNNGTSYTNAKYNFMFTQNSPCVSTLSTGTQPSQHGIIGDSWINYTTNEKIDAIYDKSVLGVGGDETEAQFSPRNLVVSTIADELKRSNKLSKVISVSLDPRGAILTGGYSPDGAYWFEPRYGHFVTSTYYKQELPKWVTVFNDGDIKNEHSSQLWHVSKSIENYINQDASFILVDTMKKFSFNALVRSKNKDMSKLLENPFGNSYVKDFAFQAIINEKLGEDDIPDLITINLGSMQYITEKYGIESVELEDAIYRLDSDIGDIIDFLENRVGKDNFVLVLTSDHGTSENVTSERGASSGTFNAMQFRVLINGFLGATLGVNDWVSAYENRHIYLNRRLIYEQGLSLSEIQSRVANFAIQFGGVASAVTSTAMQDNYYYTGIQNKIQNSYFPKYSGDVIVNLFPGWIELESEDASWVMSSSGSPYGYDTHVPLIFYGSGIPAIVSHQEVDMINVAPTICDFLGVSHPNASEGRSLIDIIRQQQ